MGNGNWRSRILFLFSGSSCSRNRCMRAEAGNTKRLPSSSKVADAQVLEQLPVEATSIFGDHQYPTKAKYSMISLKFLVYSLCAVFDCFSRIYVEKNCPFFFLPFFWVPVFLPPQVYTCDVCY